MNKHDQLKVNLFNRLVTILDRKHINIEDLSEEIGVSKSQLKRFVNGQRVPGYETIVSLAEELGIDVEELCSVTPEKEITLRFNKLNPYEKTFIIKCFDMIENLPETAKLMFPEEVKE